MKLTRQESRKTSRNVKPLSFERDSILLMETLSGFCASKLRRWTKIYKCRVEGNRVEFSSGPWLSGIQQMHKEYLLRWHWPNCYWLDFLLYHWIYQKYPRTISSFVTTLPTVNDWHWRHRTNRIPEWITNLEFFFPVSLQVIVSEILSSSPSGLLRAVHGFFHRVARLRISDHLSPSIGGISWGPYSSASSGRTNWGVRPHLHPKRRRSETLSFQPSRPNRMSTAATHSLLFPDSPQP